MDQHGEPHADLNGFYFTYRVFTEGVRIADNATIRLDLENEPQPECLWCIDPAHGGNARIGEDGYLLGAPELVGEVCASSVSIDLNTKFRIYRRNSVQEYMVWRVQDKAIDWFHFENGQYRPVQPGVDGILRSVVFPGLWLDPLAQVKQDLQRVLAVLQQGLVSPEQVAFVESPKTRKTA